MNRRIEHDGVAPHEDLERESGVAALRGVYSAHRVLVCDIGSGAIDGVGREDGERSGGEGCGHLARTLGRRGPKFTHQPFQQRARGL